MHQLNKLKHRSVFRTILFPLLILLGVEILFLLGSLVLSGVTERLNKNARDILNQQVENRRDYLENTMVGNWSGLTLLAEGINQTTQQLLDAGVISLEELDSNSDACAPLLLEVVDDMISTLYAKQVSGVFIVFNTHPFPANWRETGVPPRTGIYIRDLDPSSLPSARKADLLLERAPIRVVQKLNISTDSGWQPMFSLDHVEQKTCCDFFYRPYQAAVQAAELSSPSDYGYWSAVPFQLLGSTDHAISYSIPLVLSDGNVYGVLGVDLLTDYLRTLLPYEELSDDKQGSYFMAVSAPGTEDYTINLISGPAQQYLSPGDTVTLSPDEEGNSRLELGSAFYHARGEAFTLYSSNTVFESERWILVGLAPEQQLYAFSRQMKFHLYTAVFFTLFTGVLGSLIISRRISKPIHNLSQEVRLAQRKPQDIFPSCPRPVSPNWTSSPRPLSP